MRELKFRVWSDFWEKYADFEAELYMDGSVDADFEDDNGIPHHESTDLIIEQYTGLKDKNGKEIYEGDIIKDIRSDEYYLGIYKVEFDLDRAGFVPFACGDGCGCCENDVISDSEDVEVIGNIHENPELMEKK